MFKKALFVLMIAGCMKHPASDPAGTAGIYGFAGENFISTNSPCLDGVLVAIDHSCAVPMEVEEGYPYLMIQCTQVRPEASFDLVAVTPNRGSASEHAMAQSTVKKHTNRVLKSLLDMGLPASRISLLATSSNTSASNEVHIYIR